MSFTFVYWFTVIFPSFIRLPLFLYSYGHLKKKDKKKAIISDGFYLVYQSMLILSSFFISSSTVSSASWSFFHSSKALMMMLISILFSNCMVSAFDLIYVLFPFLIRFLQNQQSSTAVLPHHHPLHPVLLLVCIIFLYFLYP